MVSPIIRFFEIETPPAVLIVPLVRLVATFELVTIRFPSVNMFPDTSKTSSGSDTLIPTLLSITRSIVSGIPLLLICKSKLLPSAEL